MSRNGSGTYSLPEAAFVYDTVISETAVNSNFSDIATALTASLAKDGQTTPTANLPMGGYKHTGAATTSGGSTGEYLARDYWLTQRHVPNVVINPSGEINQMGTTSTADDVYGGPDAWYTLNQSNATSWAQGTNMEATTPFYQRGTQSNSSAQRFGRAQIIESAHCRHLRGQAVVLSARVQMSASTTIRYAVLEWTGTADSVTSDVVNDWTSSTFTAGNFFISTTTNVLATGSLALSANTPATITELDATVGASMNNLVVVFWTDSTQAQNVTLDIAKVSLKIGSDATPYYPRPIAQELQLCQRYFYQWTNGGSQNNAMGLGALSSTTNCRFFIPIPVPMRTTPTLSVSAVANFDVEAGGSSSATSNITLSASTGTNPSGAILNVTVSGLTAGQAGVLFADANEYLRFDARL